MTESRRLRRALFMAALIVAGEAIFSLPFHVARFFRPTVLEVFQLSNTELGVVQAVYGVVAMLAYFPGGPLADRVSARRLLTLSLAATSAGGVYFATFPPYRAMWALFGFWGVTTILLFWAALIRATREWGGDDAQGRAYGLLDGGRGLFAAVLAAASVLLFESLLTGDPGTTTELERARALRGVIYGYTAVTAAAAVLCGLFVVDETPGSRDDRGGWEHVRAAARLPGVWLQAAIVVCAYVGYKGIDNDSLFAVQAYGMDEVEGARVTAIGAWVRPFAAVGAGWLGDRMSCSRVAAGCFALMLGAYAWLALQAPRPDAVWVLYTNVMITCLAVFGLRGVYFALFEEASVPLSATGSAVGLVSVIGYTPDVFVNLVAGWLLDRSAGAAGHRWFFGFLALFALFGIVATAAFRRAGRLRNRAPVASGADE